MTEYICRVSAQVPPLMASNVPPGDTVGLRSASPCKGCMAICGTVNKPKDPEKCAGYIPKTNGNFFRGATDEIIAEFIASNRTDCYRCVAKDLCEEGMCKNAWIRWLQSMAEE